jgi:hypothetical protein
MTPAWLLGVSIAIAGSGAPALQPLGKFHQEEAVARDGEAWLALRVIGSDAALVPTTTRLRTVRDEIVDEPGQPDTGIEVDATVPDALILLRGNGLVDGVVASVPIVVVEAEGAPRHDLAFRGRHYRIRTECRDDGVLNGQPQLACEIRLEEGGVRQLIARSGGYREPGNPVPQIGNMKAPKLLFAGDLDRDGALDLIMDVSDHYNSYAPMLFLSSKAGDGELVGEAAVFESTGC